MSYPAAYHPAISHLVVYGDHGGDTAVGRRLVATALWALRHKLGRERAQRERRHMLFVAGQFPVKDARGSEIAGVAPTAIAPGPRAGESLP